MKTHTSRWQQSAPGVWILKQRAQDGGAMLATIRWRAGWLVPEMYDWTTDGRAGSCESRHAAQRAARKALEEQAKDA